MAAFHDGAGAFVVESVAVSLDGFSTCMWGRMNHAHHVMSCGECV
jgi:3-oxoacyl-[acyl-carrier-protein] synthase III